MGSDVPRRPTLQLKKLHKITPSWRSKLFNPAKLQRIADPRHRIASVAQKFIQLVRRRCRLRSRLLLSSTPENTFLHPAELLSLTQVLSSRHNDGRPFHSCSQRLGSSQNSSRPAAGLNMGCPHKKIRSPIFSSAPKGRQGCGCVHLLSPHPL